MVSLINISKKYNNLDILKDFNIQFPKNKTTCLYGPSGTGKTTIANITCKLIPFDKGIITGAEDAVFSYVFQDPILLPWYSVYDNIDFVLKDIYNYEKRSSIIDKYLEKLGLLEFKNYFPGDLSSGMAQRVSLARAFAYPSNFLIMDEPFKGLDIKLKQTIISFFLNLIEENKKTVLFITHDIDEAIQISDIIYVLNNHPVNIINKIVKNNIKDHENIRDILLNY